MRWKRAVFQGKHSIKPHGVPMQTCLPYADWYEWWCGAGMNDDAGTLREKAAQYRQLAVGPEGQAAIFELLEVAAHFDALAVQQEETVLKHEKRGKVRQKTRRKSHRRKTVRAFRAA